MQFSEINPYIAKFEELARQAGYTARNPKTMHMFIKGLTPSVMEDVLKPPHMTTYNDIMQKVIECMRPRVLLNTILWARQPGERGFQGGAFQGFQQGNPQRQLFFSRQNMSSNQVPAPWYNSSNTPSWMNNSPAPIDVGWSRVPNARGMARGQLVSFPPWGPQVPQGPNVVCYGCGQKGHFAKNCPKGQPSWANQVQEEDNLGWNDHDSEIGYPTLMVATEQSVVSQIRDQLKAVTLDQKSELADELGVTEDVPSAWLGWH
jgi:hypothetical protein